MQKNILTRNLSYKKILTKINNKSLKVAVVGLGYVGLPLAKLFAFSGFEVLGFDNDEKKISNIKNGISYINYISNKEFKKLSKYNFTVHDDFKKIATTDIIILCLPTPINKNYNPDISIIKSVINKLKKYLINFQTIILESTTFPGTTENIIKNILISKFDVGRNFYLAYSPEREDPANLNFNLQKIPKIISGVSNQSKIICKKLYERVGIKCVEVKSPAVAETAKLLENTYRSVNIALVNQLKFFCEKININVFDVINAAKSKPFGFQAFYPGPGYGGHCIPVDPHYLHWIAKKVGVDMSFISLASKINESMPNIIVKKILQFFRKKKKKLKKILIIGAAYKKNINDTRNSPALKIISLFFRNNTHVDFYDPYVKYINVNNKKMQTISLNKGQIILYDAVLIVTDHDKINYKFLVKNSKYIFDARGKLLKENNKNIFYL
jgi:UDP-N-acetyl-D-glucosamine dehydrogenase